LNVIAVASGDRRILAAEGETIELAQPTRSLIGRGW